MPRPRHIPSGPPPNPTAPIPKVRAAVTADRAVALMRMVGDLQVHVVVRLGGHVDESRLARAQRLLLDVEPVLGSRFVEGRRRPRWERLEGLESRPCCQLVERDSGGEGMDDAVITYLASPPESSELPMLRVRILRCPHHDTIAIKVNHLAADGGGSKEIAYRLAALYGELGRTPDLDPTPNLAGRRSMWQLAERLTWWERIRLLELAAMEQRRRLWPDRHWRPPEGSSGVRGAEAPGRTYVVRRLGEEAFVRLKAWGKARGATVNDLVNAAYLHALMEWLCPGADVPLRLRTTADLRRYLPGGRTEAVCNCSSFTYPNLGLAGEGATDFPGLVDRMAAEMGALKTSYPGLAEWAVTGPALALVSDRFAARTARKHLTPERRPEAYAPVLTNIGRIHGERLGFGDVAAQDAYATASVVYPPGFVACATGFGESLTLSAGFCSSGLAREEVTRLFDHMMELFTSV